MWREVQQTMAGKLGSLLAVVAVALLVGCDIVLGSTVWPKPQSMTTSGNVHAFATDFSFASDSKSMIFLDAARV